MSGGWQYSHANKSNKVTAKEDIKSFLLQCNLSTDLLVFIKLKFPRILNFSQSFQKQVVNTLSEKDKKLDTAASEFISIFIFA